MQETNKQERMKLLNAKLNLMMQKKGISLSDNILDVKQPKDKTETQQPDSTQNKQWDRDEDRARRAPKVKPIKKEVKKSKQEIKPILRKAAGIVWEDKTMEEWPQNDYRIFVGNLGKEANDEILSNAFRSRYPSFNMGRVVVDRRTGKNRGYGFVSLAHPRDFLNALKQMNGQYVGNRPVKIMKSSWKDRTLESEKNKELPSDFKTNSKKETYKVFTDYKYTYPM